VIHQQRLAARLQHRVADDVVEGRLDRLRRERRAVVEGDILAQGEGEFGVVVVGRPGAGQRGVQFAVGRHGQQRVEEVDQEELFLHIDRVAGVERLRLGAEADGERPARRGRGCIGGRRRGRCAGRGAGRQQQAGDDQQRQHKGRPFLQIHANSPQLGDNRRLSLGAPRAQPIIDAAGRESKQRTAHQYFTNLTQRRKGAKNAQKTIFHLAA
jgi:hypothetical protein